MQWVLVITISLPSMFRSVEKTWGSFMSVDEAYNFKAIDESVSTSGLLSEAQLGELRACGYDWVINLLPDDSQFAIENEEAIIAQQGIDYTYIPVDFAAPAEDDYAKFVAALESRSGGKLLIHCAANFRVSAFYAIYAHQHLGWPASRARAHIASIWDPGEHPPWEAFIARYLPTGDQ